MINYLGFCFYNQTPVGKKSQDSWEKSELILVQLSFKNWTNCG